MKPLEAAFHIRTKLRDAGFPAWLGQEIYEPDKNGLLALRYPNEPKFAVIHTLGSKLADRTNCENAEEYSLQIDLYGRGLSILYGADAASGFYKDVEDLLKADNLYIRNTIDKPKHNNYYSIAGYVNKEA